ncbi:Sas10/Utp3/C1D family-domain-containing protein [Mycotypha africana]|uniref:Sas10/Utp3/C1D family-domain-containing protein n=1 Tax=Mycotypha africana TaxID=64632 RepID=UPI002300F9DD|nr:Sas10/Utp3/C1D family-domain-containing protein [Mycotypha africana]KAI8977698.1 Sas10/Utp3/C1D family-domain-containing protein [Mycotypha africana]
MSEVATLEKPLESLTVNDADEVAEFTKLVKDLKAKVIDMKNQLKPLKQKIEDDQIHTSKGVSFLEVKYHIMLQYILQLAFYVHLKISGKQIENNPVVESLVELRVLLDKMKPIETKLKYQIDKLVRAAVLDTSRKNESGQPNETTDVEKKEEITVAQAVAVDPLAFRPNPMNLLAKDEDNEDVDEEENVGTGVYRPPKLAPVTYIEDDKKKGGKKERDEARYKEKASRSRIMKDLMTEMSENPEEIDVFGGVNEGTGFGDRVDSMIAEKNRYEEDNFVRLSVTRREKKRLNKNRRMKFESEFDNLNDFSNLAGLKDVEEQENERYRNVLSRSKKNKNEVFESSGTKRTRDEGNDDGFHGLFDGESKVKNKFSAKRHKKKGGKAKRRS